MKKLAICCLTFVLYWSSASKIAAHVVVHPAQVGVGSFQTFTVGVPSEKDAETTQVRLVFSTPLLHVTPNVKPGWMIDV